jgi:serine/threonine-protein kinase
MIHSDPTRIDPRTAGTPTGADSATKSRWRALPPDVLEQSCKRVGIAAIVFASIWIVSLLMNTVVRQWLNWMPTKMLGPAALWPMPGNLITGIGIGLSVALAFAASRLSKQPEKLLQLGLLYEIATACLGAFLLHWIPVDLAQTRISWICLIVVAYPAIVPSTPLTTLLVSFIAASMDPLWLGVAALRGIPVENASVYTVIWYVLPNYISVVIAVLSAHLITGLGRQVNQARELGAYRLDEMIGKGGMGEVYRAHHHLLARPSAIKLIRPEALGGGRASEGNVVVQRFKREAQAAASLRSPHTISLYDFGVTNDGTFYYVMELLEGADLDTLVRRFGPVPAGRAIFLLRHACHSLGEAHARGMVHRDIKPSNIHTCRLGLNVDFVKVLDFGLVKTDAAAARNETLLTSPDVTTGTPAYMAPEMALGETVDHRADIYALGCVGYWLLTGRLVFEAETPVKMMLQHIQNAPEPPSRFSELEIPRELDEILLACLAKSPADRPADTAELSRRLAQIPACDPWTKDRAEAWWDTNLPAAAPRTVLREETPVATMQVAK